MAQPHHMRGHYLKGTQKTVMGSFQVDKEEFEGEQSNVDHSGMVLCRSCDVQGQGTQEPGPGQGSGQG